MATVSEVRSLLDNLESIGARASDITAQIALTELNLARLRGELQQLSVDQAQAEFKAAAARLSVEASK